MSNRNSMPATLPTILTTLSSERPLSFSEFEQKKDVDGIMSKNFDEMNEQQLTTRQQHHDNNKSKTTTKSKTTLTTTTTGHKNKLLKLKSKSSSTNSTTPTPPSTASSTVPFNQDEEYTDCPSNTEDADHRETQHTTNTKKTKKTKRGRKSAQKSTVAMENNCRDWEILEGLKLGQSFPYVPEKHEGYIMKNRKWPMKGWHKRYFSLKNGYLIYAKSPQDIKKGRHHVQVDIGLSVIVCKQRGFRIDMDADDTIYHLKTKTQEDFDEWKNHLRDHRLFRQNAISTGCDNHFNYEDDTIIPLVTTTSDVTSSLPPNNVITTLAMAAKLSAADVLMHDDVISDVLPGDDNDGNGDGDGDERCVVDGDSLCEDVSLPTTNVQSPQTVAAVVDVDDVVVNKKMVLLTSDELNEVQLKLCDLGMLLADIQHQHNNNNYNTGDASVINVNMPMKKKEKRNLLLRKDKKQHELIVPDLNSLVKCSSNPSIALNENTSSIPTFHPSSPSFIPSNNQSNGECEDGGGAGGGGGGMMHLQNKFYKQAEYVLSKLDKINNQLMASERSRNSPSYNDTYVKSLKLHIADLKKQNVELKKQNVELKGKLSRINTESILVLGNKSTSVHPTPILVHPQQKTASVDSSDSLDSGNNQFYDAPDQLEPSSDGSEEDEEEDEASDAETKGNEKLEPNMEERFSRFQMRRRSRLPSPSVSSDVSIWGLLRKNIGKDLSKISMPVVMNEPLNALQRLCEELEYSELLERAVEIEDPYERMVWVAVFTVSTYANTFTRAARKPFNPLLGETFEIDRSEKGWRFVAEQVSHHPPVSASFCESKHFTMWQDMQVKTKFWGKSMEVQPIGTAHLFLNKHEEEYTWNKATSCIHNILGGQRWVEHYGEVVITNHTRGIVCKLNYAKSSYFSAKKYEVYGQVHASDEGPPLHHLFGRWNESIFHGQSESTAKCIWRPGALPPDHHLYYGFTKFAMELNEIDKEQENNYPCTDTRFRPDQRLLELGRVDDAEMEKRMVEQKQRDMRKNADFDQQLYQPNWFTRRNNDEGTDTYTYNGDYWSKRNNPGFSQLSLSQLW